MDEQELLTLLESVARQLNIVLPALRKHLQESKPKNDQIGYEKNETTPNSQPQSPSHGYAIGDKVWFNPSPRATRRRLGEIIKIHNHIELEVTNPNYPGSVILTEKDVLERF